MDDEVRWQPLLREALAVLAALPEEQVRCHGPVGCIACELLLDFDHARSVALGNALLTDAQRSSLDEIDAAMDSMAPLDMTCFDNAVVDRPAWQTLRGLAGRALREFGWEQARAEAFVEIEPGLWHRPRSSV